MSRSQSNLDVFFADNDLSEGHGRQSLRSGVIAMAGRGGNVVIQIASTIILARLLMPEDFGLFAMMAAITSLTPVLMDLGTRDAAVQKPRITRDEITTLFWLSLGIAIVLALVTASCSSVIANFYHEPRLENIVLAWTLTFITSALSLQHTALLRRAMMFDKINVIEVGANLFGAASAVTLALIGVGYWALVFRPILTALAYTMGVWLSCPWVPGTPRMSSGVKEMVTFGTQITIFAVTDAIGRSADRIALGHSKGAEDLGYYQNASVIYENPLGIFGITVHTVAVTSLAKLRHSPDELRRVWSKALSALAFFAMPVFVFLAVTGPDIIVLLLGGKWLFAGTILTLIALRGPVHVLERSHGWLHVAGGTGDRWVRWGIASSIIQVVAVLCGMPFGSVGIATAGTICVYLLFIPAILYSGHPFGINVSHLYRAVGPQLIGALVAMGFGMTLRFLYLSEIQPILRIAILITACGTLYLLLTTGLFRVIEPLNIAKSLIAEHMPPQVYRLLPKKFMPSSRRQ